MKQQRGGETAFAKRDDFMKQSDGPTVGDVFLGLFEREISVRGYKKWLNLKTKSVLRESDARRHSRDGLENLNTNTKPK